MTLIAINVPVDPDAATVKKVQAVNTRLRDSYPDGFALDANHAPHITLLQQFVRAADFESVAESGAIRDFHLPSNIRESLPVGRFRCGSEKIL